MADCHVIATLTDKRAEISGVIANLEMQLLKARTNLNHIDAALRMFDPELAVEAIRPKTPKKRNEWFRPGERTWVVLDILRAAERPLTSREITDRLMLVKGLNLLDQRTRELVQKTVNSTLFGARRSGRYGIERIGSGRNVTWRLTG